MTASSGKRQNRQSHAGQGGKRDFQAQFRDTTDAVRPRRTTDTATETVTSSDQSVQVELPKIPARIPADQRKPLSLFLRSVEGLVSDQLQRNLRSRAGNDFKVEWQSLSENAELVSNFPRKVFNDLPTLAVQWNSTGTLLAMA
ncbi:hypothetical protein BV898_10716 [Hypsibius exemplaris]|uniref:Uncharacterized protein n=1 Tax=Hypsibius exemplaris TaxID=2072580 RepID=A0A1W0WIP2_HYPEX|nr:hypothetical protein BV898_10716 [Hypsibius exemplaris]